MTEKGLVALSGWTYGHIVPNGITVLSLAFGMTAFTYAAAEMIAPAIGCILIAAVLDACDGRIARKLNVASKFGAELDSLSDVVCFGAAPAFITYQWGLSGLGWGGWIICLLPAIAAALRLARFNVATAEPDRPSWSGLYFSGVPAPAGAFLVLSPIYLAGAGWVEFETAKHLGAAIPPVVAALMVSTLPTFSGKQAGRKAARVLFLPMVLTGLAVGAGLYFFPWQTLLLGAGAYVCSLPLSYRSQQKRSAGA